MWILLVYYRFYAEDGAIPSKAPIAPGDAFLGRIKVGSVPPPRTTKTVKRSIAKVEGIKDRESTTLFLTPCSQTPMDDAEKVTILNGIGPGSTPQEPLALVAKMSDSERSALESEERDGLASTAEPDTEPLDVQYRTSIQHSGTFIFVTSRLLEEMYHLLRVYRDEYELPSNLAFDPVEPSLGRIRADCVAPPYSPTSIKRCILRLEGLGNLNPAFTLADLFVDTSCDTPLKEGHISISLRPPIPDGKYVIKISRGGHFLDRGMR